MRRRYCIAGILTAVALLLATAGNLLLLSTGKLFRAATLRWFGRPVTPTGLTVSDENSHVVRVIDSQRDLATFRQLWSALVEADAPSRSSRIQSIRRGVRTENAEVLLSQRLHRAARNLARHMGRVALHDALTRRF